MPGWALVVASIAAIATTAISSDAEVAARGEQAHVSDRAAEAAATRPPRSRVLSDSAAASLVKRSRWEPRPRNRRANQRRPSKRELRYFRRHSRTPYERFVTGNFSGTTDEIIQWAGHKWGFSPDVLRAVAAIESWWKMGAIGDHGRTFGIMQIKRGAHCCYPLSARSTAFNVDYYTARLRSVYDGRERWLNRERRGQRYRRGDLWGSVGVWYSGRWHYDTSNYVSRVKKYKRQRVWRRAGFWHGGH